MKAQSPIRMIKQPKNKHKRVVVLYKKYAQHTYIYKCKLSRWKRKRKRRERKKEKKKEVEEEEKEERKKTVGIVGVGVGRVFAHTHRDNMYIYAIFQFHEIRLSDTTHAPTAHRTAKKKSIRRPNRPKYTCCIAVEYKLFRDALEKETLLGPSCLLSRGLFPGGTGF